MLNQNKKIIAITAGDPSSIAPLITLRAALELADNGMVSYCLIANYNFMKDVAIYYDISIKLIKISNIKEIKEKRLTSTSKSELYILDIPFKEVTDIGGFLGVRNYHNSGYVLHSINTAIDLALNKEVSAIVTNPIDKDLVNQYMAGSYDFKGHTGYLAEKAKVNDVVMMMATPYNKLKVIPLTTHVAISEVPKLISQKKLQDTVVITLNFLQNQLNISNPVIGVCGLNPHSGENGLMGREEIEIINPVIHNFKQQGINIVGSLPSDTVFTAHNRDKFDVIIGMYHDQVLAPFKAFYFDEGVNTTLGLPFIRTSPDHGCAFSIAKSNLASAKSLISAIVMTQQLIK